MCRLLPYTEITISKILRGRKIPVPSSENVIKDFLESKKKIRKDRRTRWARRFPVRIGFIPTSSGRAKRWNTDMPADLAEIHALK